MSKKKKYKSIEHMKSRYGLGFTAIWIIGFILFFAYPIIQSVWYSLCSVHISAEGITTEFIGFENYNYALNSHPSFTFWMTQDLTSILYSLPIIMMCSLVLALLLNQNFRGRLFFRSLYFVPVIITSGVVLGLMFNTTSEELTQAGVTTAITDSMFSIEDVIGWLNMPDKVAVAVKNIINNIFDLLWSCGVQTVLFISGLQTIPRTLYEASKVEGATKWEEFWFITFPSLGNVTLLVGVYTMVEVFINSNNLVIKMAYDMIKSGNYDETSAMLWLYFLLVGVIMGAILFVYNHFLMKRWS